MTVSNKTVKLTYCGDGETRRFGITFPLLSAEHLRLIVRGPEDAEAEVTSHFEISPERNLVTYPTEESNLPALAQGQTLTLMRQTPLTQEIDLLSAGTLDAEELEKGYDKLTLQLQEVGEKLDRSVLFPAGEPNPQTNAQTYLKELEENAQAADAAAQNAAENAQNAAGSALTASAAEESCVSAASQAQQSAAACMLDLAAAKAAAQEACAWAAKTDSPVNGNEYSAKHYAQRAEEAYKNAGLDFGGEYAPEAIYAKNTFVLVETDEALNYYISLKDENTAHAVTETEWWALFGRLEKSSAGSGGCGTLRQVIVTGTQALKVTPGAETNIALDYNAKASNTSNVGTPYTAAAETDTINGWSSTEKVNAVSGVAWTAQRYLAKPVHKIRLRQSRYDGYRITSVKVQWQSDTKPIWSQSIDDTKWQDLGTFTLRDACVWEELALAAYTPTTQYHAVRILANANGTSTTANWSLHCVQMLNATPASVEVGAFTGTVANGFNETGAPADIPIVKPAYEKLTAAPDDYPATVGVYVDAAGALSLAGAQTGGLNKPLAADINAVFFDEQAQKNYIKTASGWDEFPRLAVGQLDYDADGNLSAFCGYALNTHPWGTFVETLSAAGGELTLGNNRAYRVTLSSAVSFALPTPLAGQENYVQIYATVTAQAPVTWGDVLFYGQYPGATLSPGQYEILFFYDENSAKWNAGVLAKVEA